MTTVASEARGDEAAEGDTFAATLAAARRGDGEACAILWRGCAPAVAAYARAKGSVDPDDLTSDVFLAVFRQLDHFEGDQGGFRALVFTIAHRRLVDELRARSRRSPCVRWSEEGDPRRMVSAEDAAIEGVGTSQVRHLLALLSRDQRDVLELRILSDLTVEQTATVLGKQVGAVKALQRRGLAALRRHLMATRTPLGGISDGED